MKKREIVSLLQNLKTRMARAEMDLNHLKPAVEGLESAVDAPAIRRMRQLVDLEDRADHDKAAMTAILETLKKVDQ